ncbi:MAG TPA: endonuclease, partial [Fibrobacteria bacterium]|nr:endonuclease [Fibrobacteria bacterium]
AVFSRCEFDFQETAEGERRGSVFFDLDARRFFLTDKERDYTLVAVKSVGTGGMELNRFGWNKLIGEEGKVIIGEYVSIIQHPNGNPKQVALRENRIVDLPNDLFLHYETDTAPGSSGSPVFNDQWEVVALHHSGVLDRNEAGEILALDGSVWNASMGETQIKWKANEGARISRILAHVQQADLRGFKGGLVEELLQGPPPAVYPREAWNSLVPASAAGTAGAGTITIPIHLTLALGAAGGFVSSAAPAILNSGPASPSFSNRKDLDEALKELERARKSIYYDASQDAADKAAYYDDFESDGSMTNSFRGLNRLTRTRHAKVFKYKPALHLYPWVDLQPDLQLKSIYSGKEFDAEELIREDFRIEAEREARMHEILTRETTLSEDQLRMELDALEAQSPFNCEHVVPQSYFDKREPMRGDLHHLFACASDCNSFRGNIPYFQFAQEDEVVRHDCGRREQNMFEPQSGKGPVARATLYFLLRYPSLIDDSRKEYEEERLGILLGWHRENPVTDYERHRNQAIFQMQGNRNPLIDHPEWWEGIDFSLGLG